ncbi:MAG: hypothetical protein ACM3UZ_04140 [Acidobacteriota bacterium]
MLDKKAEDRMVVGSIFLLLCIPLMNRWPAIIMVLAILIGLVGVVFLAKNLVAISDDSKNTSQWIGEKMIS